MKPYYEHAGITLYLADCRELLPSLECDLLLTDPPYGADNDCDYSRFSGGLSESRNHGDRLFGDKEEFDPAPLLRFPRVVIWGANHFNARLPRGIWLVWDKKRPHRPTAFLVSRGLRPSEFQGRQSRGPTATAHQRLKR